jgi:NAD(P)H-dependent FMN reductase
MFYVVMMKSAGSEQGKRCQHHLSHYAATCKARETRSPERTAGVQPKTLMRRKVVSEAAKYKVLHWDVKVAAAQQTNDVQTITKI